MCNDCGQPAIRVHIERSRGFFREHRATESDAGNARQHWQNVIELPGLWNLDMAMSKRLRINETKRLQFRMDALNVFNHPQPANPTLDINGDVPFGNIATKTGNRQFQAQIRLEF